MRFVETLSWFKYVNASLNFVLLLKPATRDHGDKERRLGLQ